MSTDLCQILSTEVDPCAVRVNLYPAKLIYSILTHMKLCLATAIHNFKWVKITDISLI